MKRHYAGAFILVLLLFSPKGYSERWQDIYSMRRPYSHFSLDLESIKRDGSTVSYSIKTIHPGGWDDSRELNTETDFMEPVFESRTKFLMDCENQVVGMVSTDFYNTDNEIVRVWVAPEIIMLPVQENEQSNYEYKYLCLKHSG